MPRDCTVITASSDARQFALEAGSEDNGLPARCSTKWKRGSGGRNIERVRVSLWPPLFFVYSASSLGVISMADGQLHAESGSHWKCTTCLIRGMTVQNARIGKVYIGKLQKATSHLAPSMPRPFFLEGGYCFYHISIFVKSSLPLLLFYVLPRALREAPPQRCVTRDLT